MADIQKQTGSIFFGIARGSVHECLPFLEIAMRKNLVSSETHAALKSSLEEISKMVTGLIQGNADRFV